MSIFGQVENTHNLKITRGIFQLLAFFLFTNSCQSNMGQADTETSQKDIILGAERMDEYLGDLKGKNIALVVNHSSLVQNVHLVDTLLAQNINIEVVFAPEHGFRGAAPAGELVKSGIDETTGIPIISLYGQNRKPTKDNLQGIDIVVLDIQDVGTRFYTYISTMHYVMEACAESKIPFIVLDRPNPNGDYIDGPVLEKGFESFVGMHTIPVVHGLTIGELATVANEEAWLPGKMKCDLKVIPMLNYAHGLEYQPPVKPSPNLPNYNSIRWYPTTCFFEGTIFSEGRGTYHPFEFIGYPDSTLGTFSFTPVSIEGMSRHPKWEGQTCWGIDLRGKTPRKKIELGLIIDFYNKFPDKENFFKNYFNTLAGTGKLMGQIKDGLSEEEIRKSWQPDIQAYKKLREKYLLYPDLD